MIRLILGVAQVAKRGRLQARVPEFLPVWGEKGASAPELSFCSPSACFPHNVMHVELAMVKSWGGISPSFPLLPHTRQSLWVRGGDDNCCRFYSVLYSEKVKRQNAEPPRTLSWQNRAQEWVSWARTEEGLSDPSQTTLRPQAVGN